ncbi:helix-turn-helix domain-containing protein [Paenibacillus gansuensis]|uniref:Helix-turn-helix domain-containing protein n=1 Tax=Paenibacillus gansuensis TaxID=306542 RepID=A0ABW5PDH1_9BACL
MTEPNPGYFQPMLPYLREGDFAVRTPWIGPEKRLLDYLLIYVQSGKCLFKIDGTPYHLSSGDYFLVQPGQIVYLEGLTDTVTPFIHFDLFYNERRQESFPTRPGQIDLSEYRHLLQPTVKEQLGIELPAAFRPLQPERFRERFLRMVGCWLEPGELAQLRAQQIAMELMLTIMEQHQPSERETQPSGGGLQWVPSYLSLRLNEQVSIETMARRAGLSPSRFRAVFKRDFGVPPHQYLLNLRIEHAQELLAGSELTLETIAGYCGFADQYHFAKLFKAKVGMTPGSYKEKFKRVTVEPKRPDKGQAHVYVDDLQ